MQCNLGWTLDSYYSLKLFTSSLILSFMTQHCMVRAVCRIEGFIHEVDLNILNVIYKYLIAPIKMVCFACSQLGCEYRSSAKSSKCNNEWIFRAIMGSCNRVSKRQTAQDHGYRYH
jgi:hypothetical protein